MIVGTMECVWPVQGVLFESSFDVSRQAGATVPPPAYQQRSDVKAPIATLAEIY